MYHITSRTHSYNRLDYTNVRLYQCQTIPMSDYTILMSDYTIPMSDYTDVQCHTVPMSDYGT